MSDPATIVQIDIYQDEDWSDSFQIGEGTRPMDLTDSILELTIRPLYDHVTLIRKLSSDGADPEIVIDTPLLGGASIFVSQTVVAANLTIGTWEQFLVEVGPTMGRREIWRGPMIVHPGRRT